MRMQMSDQRGYSLFDVLIVCGLLAGIGIGYKNGHAGFGMVGGIAGAVVGGAVGLIVGRLPYLLISYFIEHSLDKEDSQRLRVRLRSGKEYFITHLLLGQLMKRGESVIDELPMVVSLMKSESNDQRRLGWGALKLAFPEVASKVSDYRPMDSTDKCRVIASRIDLAASNRWYEDSSNKITQS